ncbi:MAG TPA: hypothetical protein VK610_03055 [Rhodothermales bacterium]|nr:hypothetical protein [Rhodothermales bacterium]
MKKSVCLLALLLGSAVAGCDALDSSSGAATANSDCPACSDTGGNPPPAQPPPPPPPPPDGEGPRP